MIKVLFIDIKTAERIIDNIPLGLFQEPFWWRIIVKGFNKTCKIALIEQDDVNILLIPVFYNKIAFVHRVGIPLRGTYTPYIEFIKLSKNINANVQKESLIEIIKILKEEGANWIEITCLSENDGIYGDLKKHNFTVERSSSIILNTNKPLESLWVNTEGRNRNLVRKAEKNQLCAKFLDFNLQNIDLFYSMLENTFIKSGFPPPHSKDFYILLTKELLESDNLIFVSIEKDIETVAMGMFMFNDNEINFMSGTSTSLGNKYGANNLMHWEVIKFASQNNIKEYNFGGLGIPSIDKFKRSFGGYETNYTRYIWMKSYINFIFQMLMWFKNKLLKPFLIWYKN